MNIFRNRLLNWFFALCIGLIAMVGGYKLLRNGSVTYLYGIYENVFVDILILGLLLPDFSLIILKTVTDYMSVSKIMALQSRQKWWKMLLKDNVKICVVFSAFILIPSYGMICVFSGNIRNFGELLYMGMLFLSYVLVLLLLSLLIVVVKLKWNQNAAAVIIIIAAAFIPNILSYIFREYQLPTISGIMNSLYAFHDGRYLWIRNELVCMLMVTVFIILSGLIRIKIKRQDFLWKYK